MNLRQKLEQLKELEAKATSGNWYFQTKSPESELARDRLNKDEAELVSDKGEGVIQSWDYEGYSSGIFIRNEDAKLIEELRNHAKAMIEALLIADGALEKIYSGLSDETHYPEIAMVARQKIAALFEGKK